MTSTPDTPMNPSRTRRTVVSMAGASGLAVALTACGGSKSKPDATSSPSATVGSGSGSGGQSPAPSNGKGVPLARTSEIPEGGGVVFAKEKVVVTQPSAGVFKGFSAVCTHQGCTVSEVKEGTIFCPCHGSRFSIADGSVAHGPAVQPLPAEKVTATNGELTLG